MLDTKDAKTHRTKPLLVTNFESATLTKTGRIRKPATFLGWRLDKKNQQVVREVPKSTVAIDADAIKDQSVVTTERTRQRRTRKPKLLNKIANGSVLMNPLKDLS